jgi:hypothetical protein
MSNNYQRRKAINLIRCSHQVWRRLRTRRSNRPSTKKTKTGRRRPTLGLNLWKSTSKKDFGKAAEIIIPNKFSFLENPIETINALADLNTLLRQESLQTIRLNNSNCDVFDLCASAVLDVLMLRGRQYRRRRMFYLGEYSKNEEVNVLIRSVGLQANFRHKGDRALTDGDRMFELCKLQQGYRSNPAKSTESERVSSHLVDFLNNCLRRHGFSLHTTWKADIGSLITEVLDNCEQHARTDGNWYATAYYKQNCPESPDGEFHLTIFNFGDSIHQSFQHKTAAPSIRQEIKDLLDHQRKNYVHKRDWNEESLSTLYALQEGVSRYTGTEGRSDRGRGTARMIEAFRDLSAGSGKMVLVSGGACIFFDGRYKIKVENVNGEDQRVIAFNDQNSLLLPPDPTAVTHMTGAFFPGTLVSVRFDIKQSDLALKQEVVCERAND